MPLEKADRAHARPRHADLRLPLPLGQVRRDRSLICDKSDRRSILRHFLTGPLVVLPVRPTFASVAKVLQKRLRIRRRSGTAAQQQSSWDPSCLINFPRFIELSGVSQHDITTSCVLSRFCDCPWRISSATWICGVQLGGPWSRSTRPWCSSTHRRRRGVLGDQHSASQYIAPRHVDLRDPARSGHSTSFGHVPIDVRSFDRESEATKEVTGKKTPANDAQ